MEVYDYGECANLKVLEAWIRKAYFKKVVTSEVIMFTYTYRAAEYEIQIQYEPNKFSDLFDRLVDNEPKTARAWEL